MSHRRPSRATPRSAARAWALRLSLVGAAALVACGGGQDSSPDMTVEEDLDKAQPTTVVDGRLRPLATAAEQSAAAAAAAPGFIPNGDANAGTIGVFGPVLPWPIIPIHEVLMPDGRVLIYGTNTDGLQGGKAHYAVWDPSLGTGPESFLVLMNTTGTDTFCAAQVLLPDTGEPMLIGGDLTVDGVRNYATADVNIFSPSTNTLTGQPKMAYPRWYASGITIQDGRQLVMGGRMDRNNQPDDEGALAVRKGAPVAAPAASTVATYATTPEIWSRADGWKTLTGAVSEAAFGTKLQGWYYPRAWTNPFDKVFVLGVDGAMYLLNPKNDGVISAYKGVKTTASSARLQAVMYAPGKIIAMRNNLSNVTIDINGTTPVLGTAAPSTRFRQFGSATLLADGQVWMNGGGANGNVLDGAYFASETWNPATNTWTDGPSAAIARLYHSNALLMPDGTVVTGGGGAPGPLMNLNSEIFYPPYLYKKDGTGKPAVRPEISSAPDVLGWGKQFQVTMSTNKDVGRVTLVRTGVVTHDFNSNQRFQELPFTQNGKKLTLTTPASNGIAPPGYYMLFVFNTAGVPSVAKIFKISN